MSISPGFGTFPLLVVWFGFPVVLRAVQAFSPLKKYAIMAKMALGELKRKLEELGLSEKEASVYLASLELGASTAAEIAAHAAVNRATTYAVIEDLKKQGLMTSLERGAKTLFMAESPERLGTLLRAKEQGFREGFRGLEQALPELTRIFESAGERPRVRFFEGEAGIAAVREDILKTKTDFFDEIIPLDEVHRFFPPRKGDHRERMQEKLIRIKNRIIYTTKQGAIFPRGKGLARYKFVAPEKLPIATEVVLYGNKVVVVAYKQNLVGVVIEDEVITKAFRVIFDMLWQFLP